jgi:hypothetical protein
MKFFGKIAAAELRRLYVLEEEKVPVKKRIRRALLNAGLPSSALTLAFNYPRIRFMPALFAGGTASTISLLLQKPKQKKLRPSGFSLYKQAKTSHFQNLRKNQVPLTPEERAEVMRRKAV